MGYVAEIAVQIAGRSYQKQYAREQLSDYDVLGIRFEKDLHLEKIAAECKAGASKALEELLKLSGVLSTFGIRRGFFIKTKIHTNAREVAAGANITVLDEEELKALLSSAFGVNITESVTREKERFEARGGLEDRVHKDFPRVHEYLRFEFWNLEPHRNLHNLMSLMVSVGPNLREDETAHRYLFYRVLYYLSLTGIHLAGRVLGSCYADPARMLAVYLYGGPRERREREILFDQVSRLIGERGKLNKFDPPFLGSLAEVVVRLIRSSPHAAQIPEFENAVIGHLFLGDPDVAASRFSTVTRKLSQDICLFLQKEAGTRKTLGEELLRY